MCSESIRISMSICSNIGFKFLMAWMTSIEPHSCIRGRFLLLDLTDYQFILKVVYLIFASWSEFLIRIHLAWALISMSKRLVWATSRQDKRKLRLILPVWLYISTSRWLEELRPEYSGLLGFYYWLRSYICCWSSVWPEDCCVDQAIDKYKFMKVHCDLTYEYL